MKQRHLLWLCGLSVLLMSIMSIAITGVWSWSEPAHSIQSDTAFDRVTIAIVRTDINRLPDAFVEHIIEDYPPLDLSQAATAPIDALLISRETLVDTSMNTEDRAMLDALLDNQKILLVYGATTTDLQQSLHEPLNTVQMRETETVFSSLHRIDGIVTTGQLVVSDDREPITVGSLYGYVDRSLQNAKRFSPYPE
ncbi:MAG: hypothetical protein HC837_06565 [Chloroflexaceae bacterium]|nr:hypothetical protein [Chloroflexaceae bacterium]